MDRKELLSQRKNIMEEIEITKGKLGKLNEIIGNLKKEDTPIIEDRQGFIKTCLKFIKGEIEESKVKDDLQKFNNKSGRTEIGMILVDLEELQKDLQRQLQEQNESGGSIEKYLWRLVFEELKAKLHDQTRPFLEKVLIAAINARVASDFNLLFADIFGKFQRGPSQERRRSIEEEVRREWQ